MQLKLFTIPVLGGDAIQEDMNLFLRGHRVLQVENQLVTEGGASFWCFCIRYLEGPSKTAQKGKRATIDYRDVLDAASFVRFSAFREIRKKISQEEAIPAYAVFTNEELALMAKSENLDLTSLKNIKGIGARKVEKYGKQFISLEA